MIPPLFIRSDSYVTREERSFSVFFNIEKLPVTPVTPVTGRWWALYFVIKSQFIFILGTGEKSSTCNTCNNNISRVYMEVIHG